MSRALSAQIWQKPNGYVISSSYLCFYNRSIAYIEIHNFTVNFFHLSVSSLNSVTNNYPNRQFEFFSYKVGNISRYKYRF